MKERTAKTINGPHTTKVASIEMATKARGKKIKVTARLIIPVLKNHPYSRLIRNNVPNIMAIIENTIGKTNGRRAIKEEPKFR
ncbi:hypothetical protein [Cuniculiplasma divulgatum]|uniref:hypothetical protein n=1 Tax=Cuniculiplasma divulgatum TaxID=1673428 RepID=UPI0009F87A61|nr:hypothetical protein [Cuniculiplasma divulgatum]